MNLIKNLSLARAVREQRGADTEIHFHRGPQGQPTPCFDDRCASPRLSPEDFS